MSGLETLPPDQRAVLQLILVQGRGYADLAATLRLEPAAVRERALAAAAALAAPAGEGVDAATRGRVVDYLLGQQDDGERIVTFAALGDSPAACRWAQALRERLAPVAHEQLPEVPAPAVTAVANGNMAGGVAVASAPPRVEDLPPVAPPAPPHPPRPASSGAAGGPRPSRLGGAILIAGVLALAIVLAIVLIGGGDDGGSPAASTSGAQTQAARSNAGSQTSTTGASATTQARTVGGAVLRSPTGGSGLGAALVQQYPSGRRLLAVEAARLPGNAPQQYYGIWLQGSAGNRFFGFVPNQVRANGTFTVSAPVARAFDLSAYSTVLITTEDGSQGASTPTTPGTTVLSGPLRLTG